MNFLIAPPILSPVRVLSTETTAATLEWAKPLNPASPIIDYQLQYSNGNGIFTNQTKSTNFKLDNLEPATSYIVKVLKSYKMLISLFSLLVFFFSFQMSLLQPQP